jgi:ribosomal protein S18 acetylase RimI-like enzyme
VDVTSLAYRTDLALLEQGGSRLEDRGDHLVVRSPHNPTFWWGNFLLLERAPADQTAAEEWLTRFAEAFPDAEHVAIGVDGADGTAEDLAPFQAAGLEPDVATVMTASSVHEPPRPNRAATYRPLESDDDWSQSVDLQMASDTDYEPVYHRRFVQRKAATNRALVEAGHGGWFGAFVEGRLRSQMGLVAASPGLARFQSVETHPDARGQGLAGTLVHYVSTYGLDELGATTLVMVADPEYLAIRIYRSVGFTDGESQLQVARPPAGTKV